MVSDEPMAAGAVVVDVGVVTWNTRDLTVACLRRLLDTEQGISIRLLVHDNGSSDGTVEALVREVPEAEVAVAESNLGFAVGMNRLLARSSAPWFLALNSDAWPEPGAIARLVSAGDARPRVAAVAPRVEGPDGRLEHTTQAFPSPGTAWRMAIPGYAGRRPDRAYQLLFADGWHHDVAREVDWAIGAALLMRKTAIDVVGNFDSRLFMYGEDLDWCWRTRAAGWSIWFEPDAIVRHVGNASGAKRYGARRDVVSLYNTYRVACWHQGRLATATAWLAYVTGAAIGLLRSGPRTAAGAYWRGHLRAALLAARALLSPSRASQS